MKKRSLLLILFLMAILSACGFEQSGYKNVSPEEAKQLIDSAEVVVLDVRTVEEFQAGHIPNSMLIPVQELEQRLDELNDSESYLIVCRSGNRSAQASEILINNGFTTVYNMTGGMNDWAYEVER